MNWNKKRLPYETVTINDGLYEIISELPMDRVKDVTGLREHLKCSHAFKVNKKSTYIFCRLIQEPEWEEI